MRREVIHQLCIASMAHSELAKALPEDVSPFTYTNTAKKYSIQLWFT